jgi:hypothetical protein
MVKLYKKIAGGIQIIFSSFWVFRNLSTIYDYRVHPEILRLFWIPEWILFIQAIIGIMGIVIGILVFQNKMKVRNGYLIFVIIWILGFGTEFILIRF